MNDITYNFMNKYLHHNSIIFIKIIVLVFLLFWFLNKFIILIYNSNKSNIKIIDQIILDNNKKIIVIYFKKVKLMLGITLNKIQLLHIFPSDISTNCNQNIINNKNNKYNFFKLFVQIIFILIMLIFLLFFMFYSTTTHALELSDLNHYILFNSIKELPVSIKVFCFFTCVTIFSVLILMTTSFTRIIIVLSLLRNALGIPYAPPNQILLGLSFLLTFFVMSPTIDRIYQEAYIPFQHNKIQIEECIKKSIQPISDFMVHQTYKSDLKMFSTLSNTIIDDNKHNIPIKILLPSFITSELKTAFQIGFTIFLPFLIIDLIIASILMSLGMIMISPTNISLPIKLILFVLVDGWELIFSSLIKSFH